MSRRTPTGRTVVVRDAVWNTVLLDPVAVRVVDSPAFQRLRYIKQLGLAHLVYPGATHTRFDHALGVYHLARRAIGILRDKGASPAVDDVEARLVALAGLLHDIGHYPFSHAVEELEEGRIPGHHEVMAGHFLSDADVAAALESVSPDAAQRVEALIRGSSSSPLQGLVSGTLDLDKIEYLKRDAQFAGVPYGDVDVDRLIHALVVLSDPATGEAEVGVEEKGVAALESLLFSKYQMFRNVYWHHAVRAATVMYKRIVDDALSAGVLQPTELVGQTDEVLLALLAERAESANEAGRRVGRRIAELRARRLPKRAAEVAAADVAAGSDWLGVDSPLKRRVEEGVARDLELEPDAAFLDYPEKPAMFALDLLVKRGSGEVIRLGPGGHSGLIGLPRIAGELYRSARMLRLFTLGKRRRVEPTALAALAAAGPTALAQRLERGERLLGE
jgi:uncharacterized protein